MTVDGAALQNIPKCAISPCSSQLLVTLIFHTLQLFCMASMQCNSLEAACGVAEVSIKFAVLQVLLLQEPVFRTNQLLPSSVLKMEATDSSDGWISVTLHNELTLILCVRTGSFVR